MKLLFWRKTKQQNLELDAKEREAHEVHVKNIGKIVQTREKVDRLNVALKQNNIVFQLASVIGQHK